MTLVASCKQEFPKYFLNFLTLISVCDPITQYFQNITCISLKFHLGVRLQIDCLLKIEVLSSLGENSMQISTRIFIMVTSCTLLFQNMRFSCISRLWAKKNNPRRPYRIDVNDHETMQSNNRGCTPLFCPPDASPQHNIAPLGNIVNDDDRTDQNWITPSLRIPLVWHPLSTFVFSNYFGGLFVI